MIFLGLFSFLVFSHICLNRLQSFDLVTGFALLSFS